LHQARRAQKRSLREISSETNIQPWVLEALEEDRLHEIMSPVYARGFLTTYAKYLSLAPEPLLAEIPWPPSEVDEGETLPPPVPFAWPRLPLQIPWGAARDAAQEIVRRFGKPAVITVGLVGLILLNPLQWLPRVTLPHHEASVSVVSDPVSASSAISALGQMAMAPSQPLSLTARVRGTTWVRVRADGKLLTQQRLRRGAEELWTAKRELELVIAKPSQVELALNGQPISPLAVAHRGRLLITHDGIRALAHDDL